MLVEQNLWAPARFACRIEGTLGLKLGRAARAAPPASRNAAAAAALDWRVRTAQTAHAAPVKGRNP
jgi:hypothetical protein